jgi:hypothetical protein
MDDTPDQAAPDSRTPREGRGAVPTPNGIVPPPRNGQGEEKRGSRAAAGLVPFIDKRRSGSAHQIFDRLFAYSSQAALAVCLFGFAWAVSSHFSGDHSFFDSQMTPAAQAVLQRENAERAEMLRTAQKMAEDVRALKANVEVLRASLAQNQAAKEASALDGLKKQIDAVKTGTSASIAELSSKLEHMQQEPAAKLAQVIDRLDRIERQTAAPAAAPLAASSSGAVAAAKPPAGKPTQMAAAQTKPAELANGEKDPQLITDWVVRDVYDGIALVENARGAIEVMPGETIPGAGTVKSIEKRGDGWIVITSRGLVDAARDNFQP